MNIQNHYYSFTFHAIFFEKISLEDGNKTKQDLGIDENAMAKMSNESLNLANINDLPSTSNGAKENDMDASNEVILKYQFKFKRFICSYSIFFFQTTLDEMVGQSSDFDQSKTANIDLSCDGDDRADKHDLGIAEDKTANISNVNKPSSSDGTEQHSTASDVDVITEK